jgi:hypothetical protein
MPENLGKAMLETRQNINSPLPQRGSTNDNLHDKQKKFNYIDYYVNVV